MPFVERDAGGSIKGVYANRQEGYAEEFLPDTDSGVLSYLSPPVSEREVDAERNRRIALGFAFAGVFYQGREQDQKRIAGACQLATLALAFGGKLPGDLYWHGGVTPFVWIAADNSLNAMDAPTVIEFAKAAASAESAHIFAARAIKDRLAAGEVFDIYDPSLWPSQ